MCKASFTKRIEARGRFVKFPGKSVMPQLHKIEKEIKKLFKEFDMMTLYDYDETKSCLLLC